MGCDYLKKPIPVDGGTTAMIQLPDDGPPILTKALADKLVTDMPQVEALKMIRDAGFAVETAISSLQLALDQAEQNPIRYSLTFTQGKRKFSLEFREEKLKKKAFEGLE